MTTPLKIPVEPLSDQRWARLQLSLFTRYERERAATNAAATQRSERRLPLYVLLASATAAVMLAVVVHLAFQSTESPLQRPSHIATGTAASQLVLPGLSLEVRPGSAVVVGTETKEGLLIVVQRGGIACEVAPRNAGSPLMVQAGATRVRVMGTRFTVARDGKRVLVQVGRGSVEVSEHGRTWQVNAGQSWSTPVAAPGVNGQAPPPSTR